MYFKTMNTSLNKQSGVVLMVSLIMLLLLSVIGVTGSQTTVLEEKMAGNDRDRNIAFQAAEAALRGGEQMIETLTIADFDSGTDNDGLFDNDGSLLDIDDDTKPDNKDDATWDSDPAITSSIEYSTPIALIAAQPRFYIEYIGQESVDTLQGGTTGGAPFVDFFKVTARGTGRQSTTQVYLQSYYGRIFP